MSLEESKNTKMPELNENVNADYENTFADIAITLEDLQQQIDDIKTYLVI